MLQTCVKIPFTGELHIIRGEDPHDKSINTQDKENYHQCAVSSKHQDYEGLIST